MKTIQASAKSAPSRARLASPKPVSLALRAGRDATGHLSFQRFTGLRALSKQHRHLSAMGDTAFIDGMRSSLPYAEALGEEFVRTALSGEDEGAFGEDSRVVWTPLGTVVDAVAASEDARLDAMTDYGEPLDAPRKEEFVPESHPSHPGPDPR